MKLTPEQLRKIKMLALHPSYNTFTAETVNLLIADLEEAQEQITLGKKLLREDMQRATDRGEEVLKLEAELADMSEAYAEQRRLVRELDVILCGESGAARQASLCDLVGYVKHQLGGITLAELAATRKQLAEAQALIEPYRKDAACWQFARKELSWSRAWFEQVRWAMHIEMDAPNIAAGRVTDDSVARELDAAVLAAIAAKGETNDQTYT